MRIDYAPESDPQEMRSCMAFTQEDSVWIGGRQCSPFRPLGPATRYRVTLSLWTDTGWVPAPGSPVTVETDSM